MDMRLIHLLIFAFSLHLRSVSAKTQNRVFVAEHTNLAGTGSIYSATTDNLNFTQIPIDEIGTPFSVTFDPIEDKVYWSDSTFLHIARASTDGSNFEIVVADVTSEGMAIDELTRSLFWGDADLSRIVRTSLDGSIQEVAILENVRSPGGIVIDELARQIYWSSFAQPALIERAKTDGTGRFILVDEDLGVPQGLTVDFQGKRIYWADVSRNSIETSDLLGNNRRVVLQEDPLIIQFIPVGITVDREYVYMTSWQLRHVVRLDKYGLQPPELVGNVQLQQAGGIYSEQANEIDPTCEKDCQNGAQCRQLSDGSECICQPGYLGENCEIQINDFGCTFDPCLQGGRCVQELDYYTCVCRGGYYGINCENPPYVFVANRGFGQIYSAPVTDLNNITLIPLPIAPPEIPTPEPGVPTTLTPIPSPEPEPWAVSFDPSENILYWTNGLDGKIHRTNGIIDESIVSVGAIPYGLALNLEARTLYWTHDSKVTMANMDGSSQRIVIQEGLQQPRDIEVDAAGQHIYWTDVGTGSIERANLDGSNRVVLVDNLGEPYGITIDYQGDVLYWGDAFLNQIERLDLTTGVRSLVVEISSPDIHPFDLITFGNLVIWTDWSLPNLIQVEKSGANAGLASDGYYAQASGMHLVEGNDNSCASEPCINQGRCRQLTLGFQCVCIEGFMGSTCETATDDSCSSSPCLNGTCKQFPQGYSCECHQGYSGRLCETADIVFVVDQLTAVIYSASLVNIGDTFAALPLTNLGQPAGVTVDNLEGILYWTDIINGTISRSYLDGSGQEIFLEGLQQPSGLAFNPVTRAIFWISNNNTHIETSFLVDAYRQTIVENLDQIQDIALDSYQSHLYWTSLGLQPKIERATESGSERVNIIDTDLLIPTGLTIDAQQSRIYWSDAGKNTLEAASLDGTNRRILTDLSQLADINPFNVAIYRDFMYWTDRNLPNIGFLHRYLGIANAIGPQILQNAGGLAIYTSGFMLAECTDDQYACHDGLECIPYVWVCNIDPDCTDNSDELPLTCDYYRTTTEVPTDYPTTETEVPTDYPTTEVTTYTPGCRLDNIYDESTEYELYTITCSTGECIAIPCDGIFDCEDGSDESPELCDFVDVRLFGGKLPNTGRVEVYFNGQWGTVCDNNWNDEDAQVICRQLGFPEGNHKAVYRIELRLKRSETPIWLDEVSCLGNENNIKDCYHNGWGNHYCNHREDVGVICLQDGCRLSAYDGYGSFSSYYHDGNYINGDYDDFGPFMCDSGDCIAIPCNGEVECEDGSDEAPELCDSDVNVRLVGGTPTEGRMEVYFNGQWGTVCSRHESTGYAHVVCRQLGFPEGNHQIVHIYLTEYGYGTGYIWLDGLYCNGTESNIGSCSHRGWGINGHCNHYNDVGVVCQGFCRQSTTTTGEGPPLSWRATSAGVTVESIQKCPLTTYHGGYGLANRTCLFDEEANDAFWDDPIPIDCGPEEALNLANFTKPITEGNVAEAAAWLSNVTKGLEGGGATPEDVSDIADIMTTVVDVESTDPEVTTSVTGICSNIVTATKDSADQDEFDNHFLDILRAFEHQIRHSTRLRQQLDPVVESNLAVTMIPVDPQQASISGLSFAVRQNPDTGDNAFRPEDVMTSYEGTEGMRDARASMGETRTSITLPMSLFDTGNNDTVGVGFTVHNSATLFPSNSDDGMIVSDIISANIEGVPSLNNLPEPVMIEFTAPGDNPVCVFWDFDLWSQDGCTLMARSADNRITCHCDHLTNFAVIAVPIDTIKPVISTMLTDFDNNTDSGQPYATVSWPAPTAIDNSGSVTLTSDYNSGDTFPIGTTDVTYTAVDPSGNSATFTFTILVIDVENPVISNVPATIFANTDRGKPSASVEWTSPTARDNSKSVTLTADYNSGDSFPIGDTEVTYTAIDQSGNNVTATFLVTVKDNEPPRVLSGCPVYIERFTDELSLDVAWTSPVFYDNSGMTVEQNSTATSPVVLALGRHVVDYNAWDPYGNLASCSISINVTAACLVSSASLRKGNFTWPVSRAENQTVDSNERCDVRTEERGNGLAFRMCIFNKTTGGSRWLEPKYKGCGEEDDFDLEELSETDVVEDNVDNVAEALNNVTQELENPDTKDIEDIAETFTNIVNVEAVTPEVTMAVVGIISNIHDATDEREDEEVTDQDDDNMSDQMANNAPYFLEILMALEQQITRTTALGGLGGQPLKVVEPNIALATIPAPSRGSNTGLSFLVLQNNMKDREEEDGFQSGDVKTLTNNEAVPEETRTSISLPASLFNNITGNDTVGVSFFVQNSDTLFPTNSSNQSVGGDVMSAIVVGIPDTSNLPEPVVLEFTAPGENPVCVSWDFNISDWSDEGCWFMNYTNTGRVICHCDHLTNFAVLVDVKYEAVHIILDIISKIGCGLSMVSLLVTIVIFVVFRRLRMGPQATPRKILIQMCVALFCLYLVFLIGIDQVSNRTGCAFVATLLHFFTLASIMWMGVEAHNMYLSVVKVFDAQPENFVLKASIFAWGVPLLISVISVGAGFHPYYDHLDYCFAKDLPLYYGIVLPVALVLLHNIITFSLVMYRLCKARLGGNVTKQSQTQKLVKRLQNAFAISILMGLTWVFGFFAIGDVGFAFSLIFCLCNSFQGFVVFILFCVRQDDVRRTLRPYFGFIGCQCADNQRSQTTSSSGLSPTSKSAPKSFYTSTTDFSATLPSPKPTATDVAKDFSATTPPPTKDTAFVNGAYDMHDIEGQAADMAPLATKFAPEERETNIDIESAEEPRGKQTADDDEAGDQLGEEEIAAVENSKASKEPLLNAGAPANDTIPAALPADNEGFQTDTLPVISIDDEVSTSPKEGAADEADGIPADDDSAEEKPFWQEIDDSDDDVLCAPIEIQDNALGNAMIERSKSTKR